MQSISTSGQHFSQVPRANIERSTFDRTHGHKTTMDAGKLVPFVADEVLPGDTFDLNASIFARLATPIHPLMDNAFLDTHFFFVPNRLVWDNWNKFCGEQDSPTDTTDYVVPQMVPFSHSTGSLSDYFGLPTNVTITPNALHFRAYNLIWNEWFRDENLQDPQPLSTDDGPDKGTAEGTVMAVLPRGKRHDYFTSCLPWPQKAGSVLLPTIGSFSVDTQSSISEDPSKHGSVNIEAPANAASAHLISPSGQSSSPLSYKGLAVSDLLPHDVPLHFTNLTSAFVVTSTSTIASTGTSGTINDLRLAFQTQKLLERDARGGTRYTEMIKAHFNVTSPDARLQRPEYLGGSSSPLNISQVAQTSSTDTTSPLAHLSGLGTVQSSRNGFSRSFTEHGVIIGLMSLRADLTYQQTMNRMWTRRTRLDYYWPALAHIGEQAVLNSEIFHSGKKVIDDEVFGYQERYAEYRYKPSIITGLFRSNSHATLDSWHLSQKFTSTPKLNADFIEDRPPFDRVIAVPSEPHLIVDTYIRLKCTRPMPVYGTPGMMDRF